MVSNLRTVTILGATGSVGRQTLDLVNLNRDKFKVIALTAQKNVDELVEQTLLFQPEFIAIEDPGCFKELKEKVSGIDVEVAAGPDAVIEAARRPAEWVMSAIVGIAGLAPTMAAVERGALIAFANKESLVSAGSLMMEKVKEHGARLLPVDSEHNAIYQVFQEQQPPESLILTASGGPFLKRASETLSSVTPQEAVAHPTWNMGAKISVDSATLMNKAFEVIEAMYLFEMPHSQIEAVIHPQSLIHSLAVYKDGSMLAQLGPNDMRVPISYCLAWPERLEIPVKKLNLADIGQMTFHPIDLQKFPAMKLVREVLDNNPRSGPIQLNAANEVAVDAFLKGQIGFTRIVDLCQKVVDCSGAPLITSLEDVAECDRETRHLTRQMIGKI